jgi:hypothetical protein
MAIEVTIHSAGEGTCAYSGKDCTGITVTIAGSAFKECFMSTATFIKFVRMMLASPTKPASRSPASVTGNGATTQEVAK